MNSRTLLMGSNVLMWKEAVPWLALLASLLIIVLQRKTIGQLQTQLTTNGRTKRSIEDNSLYVPVFAQISKKAMKLLCRQHSRRNVKHEHLTTTETTPMTIYRKKCNSEVSFSPPRLVATRPNPLGSVMKDGDQWYVAEYYLGYSILHFTSTKNLNQSSPHAVFTLPYPFQGTDMTVFNGSIFYNSADDIVAHHFESGAVKENKLPLSKVEESGLWGIFRSRGERSLTVRRMVPATLKTLTTWSLQDLESSSDWCNSFIRCGLLYAVRCSDGGIQIEPVYDFYQNVQISGKTKIFPEITNVSSVQYDPRSRTVVLFSAGKIFASQTF